MKPVIVGVLRLANGSLFQWNCIAFSREDRNPDTECLQDVIPSLLKIVLNTPHISFEQSDEECILKKKTIKRLVVGGGGEPD